MTHDIPHDLDFDLAKLAAEKAAEAYKQRFAEYDYRAKWVSKDRVELSFRVGGKALSGAMTVKTSKVELELDVPFLFRPFRGKAIAIIEKEVVAWIAKAKAGELS